MRKSSFATKGVACVGLLVGAWLVVALASPCPACDNQRISASGAGIDRDDAEQAPTVALARPSLEIAATASGQAARLSTYADPVALGEALQPARPGDPLPAAGGAEATADPDDEQASSTTATSTSESGSSSTTAAPGQASSTTAPPTTAPPAATAPVDDGAVPATGRVYYVSSGSGNDSNDGLSTGSPWRSMQAALKRLAPGQTLYVMNGEYRELKAAGIAHYTVDKGGTAGNWVKIAAAPGHNPVIVASQGTGVLIHQPYVEVSGLTVRGSGFGRSNNYGTGIAITDTHNVRVVGNRVSGMPTTGISATGSTKFRIIGNTVHDNAFWSPLQGSGISVWHSTNRGQSADSAGYHDRIIGNRVYRNENRVYSQHYDYDTITDGNGIIVDSNIETGYSGRTLIANNLVYDNGGRGVIVWKADRVDIMFNTAYQNGQTDGIAGGATELAAGRSTDITISNNVGWARSGLPAIVMDRVTNGRTYNNVLITDSPSGDADPRDVMHSGNPGFRNASTDPGQADFRPSSGSVLKGRAQDTPGFITTDLVGTSRSSGTPDVGAFEAEAAYR